MLSVPQIKENIEGILGMHFSVEVRMDGPPSPSSSSSSSPAVAVAGGGGSNEAVDNKNGERPVFVHLDFESHDAAWVAFYLLNQAHSRHYIMRPQWSQTRLYLSVVDKAKEAKLKQSWFSGF